MATRHGIKYFLKVLMVNAKYELLLQCTEERGVRTTALAGDDVYKGLSNNVGPEFFQAANLIDDAIWKQTVRKRVKGRMKNKANTQSETEQ